MKRVLVLGASGFIGSYVMNQLESRYKVYGIGRRKIDIDNYYSVDIYSVEGEKKIVELFGVLQPDIVVNCIGGGYVSTKSRAGLRQIIDYNVRVLDILDGIFGEGIRIDKLVHLGSVSSYGVKLDEVISECSPKEPKTAHEVAKYMAEEQIKEICNKYGIEWVILQPAQVYGPGDDRSDLYKLIKFACNHKILPIFGRGDNYMVPLVYVGDVAKAVYLSLEKDIKNKEIILAWERITWNEFGEVLKSVIPGLKILHVPFSLWSFFVYVQESMLSVLGKEPLFSSDRLPYLIRNRLYESRSLDLLGISPVKLEKGLDKTIRSYGCV